MKVDIHEIYEELMCLTFVLWGLAEVPELCPFLKLLNLSLYIYIYRERESLCLKLLQQLSCLLFCFNVFWKSDKAAREFIHSIACIMRKKVDH